MQTPTERIFALLSAAHAYQAAYNQLASLVDRALHDPDPSAALAVLALQLPQTQPTGAATALLITEARDLAAGAAKRRQYRRRQGRRKGRKLALQLQAAPPPYLPVPSADPSLGALLGAPSASAPQEETAPTPQGPAGPNVAPALTPWSDPGAQDLPTKGLEDFLLTPLVKT